MTAGRPEDLPGVSDAVVGAAATQRVEGLCTVIVTYRPDVPVFARALLSASEQSGVVVVVDNATTDPAFDALMAAFVADNVVLLCNPVNIGLASGFNAGIAHARASGASLVLLMDQDSTLEPGTAAVLAAHYRRLALTQPVAAVGPQYVDRRNGVAAPFVRFGFPFNRKIMGGEGTTVDCDFLISSGCLLPMKVLDDVGDMDASLFIDNVDLDWCMRAKHLGYRIYGICDARMQHAIGDAVRPSRWIRGGVLIHSPLRLYYSTRNRLLLYRRPHTPWVWVAQDLPRLAGKFMRMAFWIAPRRANARAMLKGLWHGMLGRSGPAG